MRDSLIISMIIVVTNKTIKKISACKPSNHKLADFIY
ncbi:hypothetical protein OCHUTO_0534 [Orientia chuto str. Dubai]|uniref:Uncharacterized protein n=1 Tax=Orientia chuto str. Dubai TaxID=1359168 RepID=A0A0F3MLE6_9RICK|nr:hypothetical protein OCHUTO_0534 [Orientia chuto str. Dubai]